AGDRAALIADITADEAVDILLAAPDNEPVVFGRYVPSAAQLRIDAFKTVRKGDKVHLMTTSFAPQHGAMFAAARTYASEAVKVSGSAFGYDPFIRFGTPGNPMFQDIGPSAAVVAMGHAMKALKSTTGVMVVLTNAVRTWQTKSGGTFRKTITTHVAGDVIPRWFVLTPPAIQQAMATLLEGGEAPVDPNEILNQDSTFTAAICAYENGSSS